LLSETLSRDLALIENLGLLAGMALGYSLVQHRVENVHPLWRPLVLGSIFGLSGMLSMATSIEFGPGIVFDLRGVPVLLAGPFGGPWSAVVAGAIVTVTRIAVGGAGAPAGVLSLVGFVGLSCGLWLLRQKVARFGPLWLAIGGAVSMVAVFAGLTALGFNQAVAIMGNIGPSMAVSYTVGCGFLGFLLMLEDRRHNAEKALEEARTSAEEANSTKSLFLAQISHELRTPMAAISGSLELLSLAELPEKQRDTVNLTRRSANTLLSLLDDLLDLSRINTDRFDLDPQPVKVACIARDVTELFRARAEKNGIDLVLQTDPAFPDNVEIDPKRLRQILSNIVGNAVKFTNRGFVELTVATQDASDGSTRMVIKVKDTGPGIPPDRHDAIFEAFEQATSSVSQRFGGTGLGLSISRKLARAMGGDITVSSAVGVGSIFTIDLPLVETDATGVDMTPGRGGLQQLVADRPLRGRTILLAEDIEANRTILTGMLEALGGDVTAVADGSEALRAVNDQVDGRFDLVLMDMNMPVMDGRAATRAIRRLPGPAGQTVVVALTADAMPEHRQEYLSAGADGFLTKPIDWRDLIELARALGVTPSPETQELSGISASQPEPTTGGPGGLDCPTVVGPSLTEQAVWNEHVQADLRRALGDDHLAQLLASWPESMYALVEQIKSVSQNLSATEDLTEVKTAAHSLAGAAGNYGFDRIAALGRYIQERPETIFEPAVPAMLEQEQARVNRLIEQLLSKV
jgi:signal transduction histidine kinase/CheY-like chemotaxis protein